MGKKRITILGDTQAEEALKEKRDREREQKKLREKASTTSSEITSAPESGTSTPPAPATTHPHKPSQHYTKKETAGDKVRISGLKGGQRIKSLDDTVSEESQTVARKLKEAEDALHKPTKKKPTVERKRGKKYLSAKIKLDPTKKYSLDEALLLLKSLPNPRFIPTVELHINILTKSVNSQANLPYSTGKTRTPAIATPELIKKIENNQIDFDILFATPAQMPHLAKLAKILGPRGLMPNPKTGTVVEDPEKAVKDFSKSFKLQLKSEPKAPVVHTIVGKLNQSDTELKANYESIVEAIKPQNIKTVYIKSTMSPSIRVAL